VGQNMLVDGSTVTLLPRAETGLIVSILFIHSVIIGSVPDPYVFGPPGSASGSCSGSGSFYHHAKNSKKNLDSYFLLLFLTFYL
jgi:hypothetical protein